MTPYISATTVSPSALLEHTPLLTNYASYIIPDMLHKLGVKLQSFSSGTQTYDVSPRCVLREEIILIIFGTRTSSLIYLVDPLMFKLRIDLPSQLPVRAWYLSSSYVTTYYTNWIQPTGPKQNAQTSPTSVP